ncbi:uncharacterized protein LOC135935802 [Cloeon dipterum]|uniref:uncharacterized protein LOC135935802 n=1 Tax=Cloeon dipterum TaxID=197152 RepID=UPI0032200A51
MLEILFSVLTLYFEITELTELKDVALLRRDLLDYISSFKAYEEDETILVSQLLRIALIFQTTPLSDSEMEKLKLVKIDQNNLAQLMALGSDKRILKLNEQLLAIFTKRSEDIPLMDTSEIPFLGMNVVCSIFRVLTNSLQFFKSLFLRTARNNFGIAVPKILFTDQLHDVIDCLEYVVETFQSEAPLMNLFYKAFKNRFTFRHVYLLGSEFLTTYEMKQKKMIAKICKAKAAMPEMFDAEMEEMVQEIIESANMNSAQCLIAAMTFAVYSNKQQKDSYDTGAKLMMSMLMVISKHDEALLAFLRNLDLERLLYKMKSLFLEFAARNNRNDNTTDEVRIYKCFNFINTSGKRARLLYIYKK